MSEYRVLRDTPERLHGPYSLRGVRFSDQEEIRRWRNAQLPILRQAYPLSRKEQLTYFWRVVRPDKRSKTPGQILFVLLRDQSERLGYGGLTFIDWEARRAELSFLANPTFLLPSRYGLLLGTFLDLVISVAFYDLGLRRIYHETYDVPLLCRERHIEVLEQFGFAREGRLREHVSVGGVLVDGILHGLLRRETRQSRCEKYPEGSGPYGF